MSLGLLSYNPVYLKILMHLTPFNTFQSTLYTDCFQLGYNEEGHCKGQADPTLLLPQRMQWEISNEVTS